MTSDSQQPKHKVLLFFGVVGAGKGTQVTMLDSFFKTKNESLLHISPGVKFRELIESEVSAGEKTKEILDAGYLMPDFVTNSLTVNYLFENYRGKAHVVFDGYPRSIEQAEMVHLVREFFGWKDVAIIFIDLPDEEAIRRLKSRGRHDDTDVSIQKRLHVYREQVLPALKHLQTLGEYSYHEVDGNQSIEKVHADILTALGYKQ